MRLLIALDGTEKDTPLFQKAGVLAAAAKADVILLNVLDPLVDGSAVFAPTRTEAMRQVVAEREAYLEKQTALLEGVQVTTLVAQTDHGEDIAKRIIRVATEAEADLLAVASRQAAGLGGLILGSVARELLRDSPCPVLVVRPPRRA